MFPLSTPIISVEKISKKIVPALHRLGIQTIRDILFYFPARYENFLERMRINEVPPHRTVTIQGVVEKIENRRTARKKMMLTEAVIRDDSGRIRALWFQQPFLARNIKAGTAVSLSGRTSIGPKGVYLQNPAYEKIEIPPNLPLQKGGDDTVPSFLKGGRGRISAESLPKDSRAYASVSIKSDPGGLPREQTEGFRNSRIHTGGLVPMYPETRGITSRWLRYLVSSFLDSRFSLREILPDEIRKEYSLPHIHEAVSSIHFPARPEDAKKAEMRFAFEELLLLQLRALRERSRLKSQKAPAIPRDLSFVRQFVRSLPYSLTDAQRRSMWEIFTDLERARPMNRLLEGDVGSGKTVVASSAILLTVRGGYRAILMAPTEILARQHYETITSALAPFGVSIGLALGSEKRAVKTSDVLVGTHALIQKNFSVGNLGLVIIDEQHRFGTSQRAALVQGLEIVPHFLSMTATPIPRTLALTIYGDLDISILDEMPKARKPVITRIVEPEKRDDAYEFIRHQVKAGRQVFVVCPRIEAACEGQTTGVNQRFFAWNDVKTVKEEHEKLSKRVFPDLRVNMLHGKMKSKEKENIMRLFKNRDVDILVSTSVVEVGVDIPNATIMMIEGAERFGLAQLHQFRGRVGRGECQSYCFLFPTDDGETSRRLRAVAEAKNGFELAEKDLAIRGPGDLFGTRQSGIPDCALKYITHAPLIRQVRDSAKSIVAKSPNLSAFPDLLKRLTELESNAHLE